MIRAIVKNGQLQPLDPLPAEWADGRNLKVEDANGQGHDAPADIDRWFADLEAMVTKNDPRDLDRLDAALHEADAEAKTWMRREMGLP